MRLVVPGSERVSCAFRAACFHESQASAASGTNASPKYRSVRSALVGAIVDSIGSTLVTALIDAVGSTFVAALIDSIGSTLVAALVGAIVDSIGSTHVAALIDAVGSAVVAAVVNANGIANSIADECPNALAFGAADD